MIKLRSDLDDEIQFHFDQQIVEDSAAGMSPEEGRYAAMPSCGNPILLKGKKRDAWRWIALEGIATDFRYALRPLGSRPLFTLTVISSPALGIGTKTAISTLLAAVWRPLTLVPDSARTSSTAPKGDHLT